jgi:hypothetical protein
MIDYRCISFRTLFLRVYYSNNVSLRSGTDFRPSTFLNIGVLYGGYSWQVGSLDNSLKTQRWEEGAWQVRTERKISTVSPCYGAADRHCGSSLIMRRSWRSESFRVFMSPRACDTPASVYGKLHRDLSCEFWDLLWPGSVIWWQFRFGSVAVLHFWVLQPGSLTVYHIVIMVRGISPRGWSVLNQVVLGL